MKYTLCIKLNIDGKEIEQELATLSLRALEKYTSYCDSFTIQGYNNVFRKDFIYYLSATQKKVANFLDKHKVSDQPLFFKCGEAYTDIPVLYNDNLDVLLITKEELNKLLDWYGSRRVSSFEDKIQLGVGLKEFLQENNLFNLIKEVRITQEEKEKRLEYLNESLYKNNENYQSVLKQIEFNIKPLVDAEKSKNSKSESEGTQLNYVVTGIHHDEDKEYTINDELTFYKGLLNKSRNSDEIKILSMLVDTTREVIEFRKSLQEKIKLRDSKQGISNTDSLNDEILKLQITLSEKEIRMQDLANGNVYFGDGELEIDDPNYGGKN